MERLLAAAIFFSLAVTFSVVAEAQGTRGKKPDPGVMAKCHAKYPAPVNNAEKMGIGRTIAAQRRQCIASGGRM